MLAKFLKQNGLRVSVANGGAEMRQKMRMGSVDLIVLDIMMPGEDGLTLCRQIRQTNDVPIVLLTAVSEETDKIVGIELGADDYVTKPFNPRELLARIRAILRRVSAAPRVSAETEAKRYKFDRWVLDVPHHALLDDTGEETQLGTAEFKLLQALVTRPGVALTRDQLLDITAGRTAQVFDRSIDNLVSRLRRRIEQDPQNPTIIRTIWGEGYMLSCSVEEDS